MVVSSPVAESAPTAARRERHHRASEWGRARQMSPLEALMWRAEADPRLRSTVAAIELLDVVPDWERLKAAHDWGTRMVPRFRERVVEPALGAGLPAWEEDPEFELGRHLVRQRLEAWSGMRGLLDLAAGFVSAPFERRRPLWQAMLVEGLDGVEHGPAAYVLKLHHSLADGLANVQLLDMLHSDRRERSPDKPWPALPAPRPRNGAGVLGEQLGSALLAAPGALGRAGGGALALTGRAAAHPRRALTNALRLAGSAERLLTPPRASPSPLLEPRSLKWRFEALEVGLAPLRAAGRAAGGTLNDAYVAALLGALRRYHEAFGLHVGELPVAIPVSLRAERDPLGGNRFTGLRLAAPVGEADPRRRIERVHELVEQGRAEPALSAFATLAPLAGLLPARLLVRLGAGITAGNDLQASNVPGLRRAAYMAGARVVRVYPFGPLPGCAAMVTLVSHQEICCIGANLDAAAFTEPALFARCLQQGLGEVLELAG
jgi:diacylglycerol O-acyltransferase